MNEHTHAKTAIFLIELLIVIAVFSVCAAVCAFIFTEAFITANDASDLNNAVLIARNAAEVFKTSGEEITAYYDKNWQTSGKENAEYVLIIDSGGLLVEKMSGYTIIAFPVAAGGIT